VKKQSAFFQDKTQLDIIKILLQKGLEIPNLKLDYCYALISFLNNFKPEKIAVGVDSVGWQGDNNNTYILPFTGEPRNNYANKKEGEEKVEYILQSKGVSSRSLTKKGTLEEWRRTVGEVTRNNDLHTFSILTALTAPALKILNEEGGFIHYVGSSSIGKSTILHVAKSVWGFDNLGSFRITDNALESVCKDSNDGAIFLDEVGEVEAEAFFKIIYMVANGAAKGRLNKNAEAKKTTFFTVLAQSTGEAGLEAKLAEKKIQAKGGQLMRMAELDADRGKGFNTFDVLNTNPDTKEKFKDGEAQAEYLKYNAQENCGVVIDEFIKNIFNIGVEKYAEDLKTKKEEWLEAKLAGNKEVEVARMAKRFSTIFASGALAVFFGIIPHTVEEIENCVNSMFQNWLERRGGDTPHELKNIIDDLYKLCIQNQRLRFQPANPKLDERFNYPNDKAGYWNTSTNEIDGDDVLDEFWIAPEVFNKEILKGRDSKSFLPLLVKHGYLKKGTDGKYSQVQRLKNEKNQRFYIIPASAFNSLEVGEDENEPTEGKNEREKYSVFKPA
jgi:putative DNA primase/helicase